MYAFTTKSLHSGLAICWTDYYEVSKKCLWTHSRPYNSFCFQHIDIISTCQYSKVPSYKLSTFERSRSKVKVTEVKSFIIGWSTITKKVYVWFEQNYIFRLSKSWARSLLLADFEKSKLKVTGGVKLLKFGKNFRFQHFLS